MFKKILPYSVLPLLFITLVITNISPHTYLMGWDNLMPELDLVLNIKRSFFAVWQEYQGLGLLGGNGHAAELPRELILLPLSTIFPKELIRQIYVFSMLLLGSFGMYKLIQGFFNEKDKTARAHASILGSMFYLLNLITLQTFYVPFEPFITQYALLPWLFYTTFHYFKKQSPRSLMLLVAINILAIPQGQVPTVFFIYFGALSFMLLAMNLASREKKYLKVTANIITTTLLINAFWLLPFIYFGLTHANVAFQAKINQEATSTIIAQNKEFGTFANFLLLKGFWFNNVDPNQNGVFTFMMQPWREWTASPLVIGMGILLFLIPLLGLFVLLKHIKKETTFTSQSGDKAIFFGFGIILLTCTAFLLNATPPFSWLDSLTRNAFPLFNQVLRFPFTKLSLLYLLCHSLFFALGVYFLSYWTRQKARLQVGFMTGIGICLILFSFPIFQGKLFYAKEKVALPKEYTDLFSYFKSQDPNTRIANFPQPTFWGWSFYRFGYGGSGFLWYGIEQPILDRAFDVWSKTSENYYDEMAQALYAKDTKLFTNILNKYQITWLVVDRNVIYPSSPKSLFMPELQTMITSIPNIHKAKSFGSIDIYKVTLEDKPNSFVFMTNQLTSANSYEWNNQDQAYAENGNYISLENKPNQTEHLYPFRSLFSGKTQNETDFVMKTDNTTLTILPKTSFNTTSDLLHLPSYRQVESTIPVDLYSQTTDSGDLLISYQIQTPQVFVNGKKVWGDSLSNNLFIVHAIGKNNASLKLNLNGLNNFRITNKTEHLGTSFLSLRQNNVFTLSDQNNITTESTLVTSTTIESFLSRQKYEIPLKGNDIIGKIEVKTQKIKDPALSLNPNVNNTSEAKVCDGFRIGTSEITRAGQGVNAKITLDASNSSVCIAYYAGALLHDQGYAISIKSQNILGKSLHFWLENSNQKRATIETSLPQARTASEAKFIVAPQDQFGQGYSLHFDNNSIGNEESKNVITNITMYPIPYNFISGIRFDNEKISSSKNLNKKQKIDVSHPNESLYEITIASMPYENERTLILSQSFDKGWKAYQVKQGNSLLVNNIKSFFPFIFGTELKSHMKINNWENGWLIDTMQTSMQRYKIVILYQPQFLEYIGLIFTSITIATVLIICVLDFKKTRGKSI